MPADRLSKEEFKRLKKSCYDRCCYCLAQEGAIFVDKNGEPKQVRLERGHLVSRHAGGDDGSLANTIPICSACNEEVSKNLTLDKRPDGWLGRYFFDLMNDVGLAVYIESASSAKTAKTPASDQMSTDGQSAETKQLLRLEDLEFRHQTVPYTIYSATNQMSEGRLGRIPTKQKISVHAAEKIALELIARAKKAAGMMPPADREKGHVVTVAQEYGHECFALMAAEFIFALDGDRRVAWKDFYAGPSSWLDFAIGRIRRAAEMKRVEKKSADIAYAAQCAGDTVRPYLAELNRIEDDVRDTDLQSDWQALHDSLSAAATVAQVNAAIEKWNVFAEAWERNRAEARAHADQFLLTP